MEGVVIKRVVGYIRDGRESSMRKTERRASRPAKDANGGYLKQSPLPTVYIPKPERPKNRRRKRYKPNPGYLSRSPVPSGDGALLRIPLV